MLLPSASVVCAVDSASRTKSSMRRWTTCSKTESNIGGAYQEHSECSIANTSAQCVNHYVCPLCVTIMLDYLPGLREALLMWRDAENLFSALPQRVRQARGRSQACDQHTIVTHEEHCQTQAAEIQNRTRSSLAYDWYRVNEIFGIGSFRIILAREGKVVASNGCSSVAICTGGVSSETA